MNFTPTKTPKLVKKMFPNYIWDIPTDKKEIYLTFDDGPTPEITNWTLEILKSYDAKATFFCIGKNIEKHPEIFQNILLNGHTVGNHTNNHIKGWQTSTEEYIENIAKAQNIINTQILNSKLIDHQLSTSFLFRPPYGQITPKQGKALINSNYSIVMWNVLSLDWSADITPQQCLNKVLSKTAKGSIIVFHDSVKANKNLSFALPKILEHFSSEGYEFKSL